MLRGRSRARSCRCSTRSRFLRSFPCVGIIPALQPTQSTTFGKGSSRTAHLPAREETAARVRGSSAPGCDHFFELDLGGEAVAIASDSHNRQLSAAPPVGDRAVLCLEPAVDLDPVPLP